MQIVTSYSGIYQNGEASPLVNDRRLPDDRVWADDGITTRPTKKLKRTDEKKTRKKSNNTTRP